MTKGWRKLVGFLALVLAATLGGLEITWTVVGLFLVFAGGNAVEHVLADKLANKP